MAGTLIIVLTCIDSLVSNEEHGFSPSISQTKIQIFFFYLVNYFLLGIEYLLEYSHIWFKSVSGLFRGHKHGDRQLCAYSWSRGCPFLR